MKRILAYTLIFVLLITSMGIIQGNAASAITSTEDERVISVPMDVYEVGEASNVTSAATAPMTSSNQLPFEDVSPKSWYYESVLFVYKNGIMKGTSDTKFNPSKNLTRAEAVTVLYRMAGEPEIEGSASFEDVRKTAYYADAVLWASTEGVVKALLPPAFPPQMTSPENR